MIDPSTPRILLVAVHTKGLIGALLHNMRFLELDHMVLSRSKHHCLLMTVEPKLTTAWLMKQAKDSEQAVVIMELDGRALVDDRRFGIATNIPHTSTCLHQLSLAMRRRKYTDRNVVQRMVDRWLDKIARNGVGSMKRVELYLLDKLAQRLR
ncbi:MAG: hypothetical protein KDB96_03850 [Flavobacteriales bacterium]|nr:hypothetical protein [Flavobacteriales bacterium]